MNNTLQKPSKGTVFSLKYHFIWFTPLQMNLLIENSIKKRVVELLKEKAELLESKILSAEVNSNSVCISLSANPMNSPHYIQRQLKSYTSNKLREEFPVLKSRYACTWTRDYFCRTGDAEITEEEIEKYKKNIIEKSAKNA